MATLQITQRRSASGANPAQRETLRTLGLRGIGTHRRAPDGPAVRGMIRAVAHLVDGLAAPARTSGADG